MGDSESEKMILEQSSFAKMAEDLENQELENFPASGEAYSCLIAAYLVLGDLTSCKFLWKRIPDSIKEETKVLGELWKVGMQMWHKDWPALHHELDSFQTPPHLEIYINQLIKDTRERSVSLVMSAFSTISTDLLSQIVHKDHYLKVVEKNNWKLDDDKKFVTIPEPDSRPAMENQQNLESLTQFVSFLEN